MLNSEYRRCLRCLGGGSGWENLQGIQITFIQGLGAPQLCWFLYVIWPTAHSGSILCQNSHFRVRHPQICPVDERNQWFSFLLPLCCGFGSSKLAQALLPFIFIPILQTRDSPREVTHSVYETVFQASSWGRYCCCFCTEGGGWERGAGQLSQAVQMRSLINCPACSQGSLPLFDLFSLSTVVLRASSGNAKTMQSLPSPATALTLQLSLF